MFRTLRRARRRWFSLAMFVLFTFSIFLLGRLSVQIGMLGRSDAPPLYRIPSSGEVLAAIDENIKNVNVVQPAPPLPSTYLMVLIMTRAEDSELRNIIRQTWLRLSTKTPEMFRHLFVLGTHGINGSDAELLFKESAKYSDLLMLNNHLETYENLTRKTLTAFSSVADHFSFEYLLKVDSDSFVRLGALLKALKDIEQHPLLYWGFLDGRARPFRHGKWSEAEWRLCDRYLPYQLGGGYVLGRRLVEYFAKNAPLLQLYRSEDVSVGAWLAGLKVRYVHDPRFDTEWTSRGCNNEYLITHKKTGAEMRHLFATLSAHGVLCFPNEYWLRPSYIYDFSRPPSECCVRKNGTRIP